MSEGRSWTRTSTAVAESHLLWAAVVVLVALLLRLHRLTHEDFWLDEAITFARARMDWEPMVADTIRRKHIPTYFAVMHQLMALGDDERAMRMPSVIWGAMTCGVVYAIGARVASRTVGLFAGLFLATSVYQLRHAQEARMYTLYSLAAACALYGLCWLATAGEVRGAGVRGLSRRAWLAWGAVGLGTLLVLYTHNAGALFVGSLNVAALWVTWDARGHRLGWVRNWVVCQALALLAWAPWIPNVLRQSDAVAENWPGRRVTGEEVTELVRDLYLDADGSTAMALLCGAGCVLAVRALWRRQGLLWGLASMLVVGPLAAYLVSEHMRIFSLRILIWAAIPAYVLVAAGWAAVPRRLGLLPLLALLVLHGQNAADYYERPPRPAWQALVRELVEQTDEHSRILGGEAHRWTTYYWERHTRPLPARPLVRVRHLRRIKGSKKKRKLSVDLLSDGREHVWVIGQTWHRDFKEAVRRLQRSKRYRVGMRRRDGSAALVRFDRQG
ncbi:MAG: glycosyltransferase family 39 protein [Myxococcales bacterium]|jgi:hypothetical protein